MVFKKPRTSSSNRIGGRSKSSFPNNSSSRPSGSSFGRNSSGRSGSYGSSNSSGGTAGRGGWKSRSSGRTDYDSRGYYSSGLHDRSSRTDVHSNSVAGEHRERFNSFHDDSKQQSPDSRFSDRRSFGESRFARRGSTYKGKSVLFGKPYSGNLKYKSRSSEFAKDSGKRGGDIRRFGGPAQRSYFERLNTRRSRENNDRPPRDLYVTHGARDGDSRYKGNIRSSDRSEGNQKSKKVGHYVGDSKLHTVYGINAATSVLKNLSRDILSIQMTHEAFSVMDPSIMEAHMSKVSIVEADQISKKLGFKDKHQGILLQVGNLIEKIPLSELISPEDKPVIIFVLDSIQDPHNVGAIIRSAFCFGVNCVIIPKQNCPEIGATIIRSSAGYSEQVPIYHVSGVPNALLNLKENGFFVVGLDGNTENDFESATRDVSSNKICFVFGSEGFGMADLTKSRCDILCRIPMVYGADSLNVSCSAAVVGYSIFNRCTAE